LRPLDLRATETPLRSSLNDLADTPADRLLNAERQALDIEWLSLPSEEGFAALSALPAEAKQRLFAWCIAATLNGQLAIEDKADPVIEAAGRRLAIPFADHWRPTAANYWGRAKKAHGLDVAKALLGPRWARDHADDKKPILAAALEMAFDPAANSACIGPDQAALDSAAQWLAPGLPMPTPPFLAGVMPQRQSTTIRLRMSRSRMTLSNPPVSRLSSSRTRRIRPGSTARCRLNPASTEAAPLRGLHFRHPKQPTARRRSAA
jgi:hypothetical protein